MCIRDREIPRYMQLADYFIGKPGPGSISEAVFMRLPVIVNCNAWTLPQERYNTVWVRQQLSLIHISRQLAGHFLAQKEIGLGAKRHRGIDGIVIGHGHQVHAEPFQLFIYGQRIVVALPADLA